MRIEDRKLMQQRDAIVIRFAHSYDPAAAHGDPRFADILQRT